jgi:hypothetical protein
MGVETSRAEGKGPRAEGRRTHAEDPGLSDSSPTPQPSALGLRPSRWAAATAAVILIWVFFAIRLMIADVWDETNGMVAFSSPATTLTQKVSFVLTSSLGFWRPLPTLMVTVVLHFLRDFDVSWRVLRAINIAMVLATLWLLWRVIRENVEEPPPALRLAFTVAFLFSGSAVMAVGWYADVFDASALLLLAAGTLLLVRGRAVEAGVVFGVAFFCKETAALVFPFLLMLLAAKRITFGQSLRAGIPAAILGAVYFGFRSRIVPFGGEGDIHGFAPGQLWPTLIHLGESFWRQTLKGSGPGVLGFAALALSLAALRRPRLVAAAVAFLCAVALLYWGMFGYYQNGVLIHYLNFIGRLYLVPVSLMLTVLALERRTIAIALLCVPILIGGSTTWRDHAKFQRMYKRIYRTARDAGQKPLLVHYPMKPLDDTVRGIRIGDIPDAQVRVDAKTGRLVF